MAFHNLTSFIAGVLVVIFGAFVWYFYTGHALFSNVYVSSENSADNIFQVASSTGDPYLTVTADGRVGIDTAVPQTALDVRGLVRVYTSSTTPCTKDIEGAIAYDPRIGHFLGCNSIEWKRLDN